MTNLKGTINLEILDGGRGYKITNGGNASEFLRSMARKGWLDNYGQTSLYLCNKYQTGRRFAFADYCERNGYAVKYAA